MKERLFIEKSLGDLYDIFSQIVSEIELKRIKTFIIKKDDSSIQISKTGISVQKDNILNVYPFELFYLYIDLIELINQIYSYLNKLIREANYDCKDLKEKINSECYKYFNALQYLNTCILSIIKEIDNTLSFNCYIPIFQDLNYNRIYLFQEINKNYQNRTIKIMNNKLLFS
jgi:hypothetical protein